MTPSDTPPLYTLYIEPNGEQCDAWATDTLLDAMEMGGAAVAQLLPQWHLPHLSGADQARLRALQN